MTTCWQTLLTATCLLFAGCTSLHGSPATPVPPQSQYDSIITDNNGRLLSINQLATGLASADVVIIGEYHGHHGAHLLQSLLQSALYQQRPQQLLSMEQFTLNDQPELENYLAGKSGEEELIADTGAWSNYKASYRPLIEFSKNRNLPVVGANAPADIVRCVGRNGQSHLDELDEPQRSQLPDNPFVDTPAYRKKFFDTLGGSHGGSNDAGDAPSDHSTRLENSYKAQLLRDNTMADQVIMALDDKPDRQVVHLTGTFHAENRLGMVAVLEKKRPELEVAVVSPVFWQPGDSFDSLLETNRGKGDFLYFLQPLPVAYRDTERHREAIMEQFSNAAELSCG
jgi:uncharacterized iron-regulated protein